MARRRGAARARGAARRIIRSPRAGRPRHGGRYDLTLFVMDMTPRSRLAIANTRALCDELLKGRYTLHVVDMTAEPRRAQDADIFAAPTLLKRTPLPVCRLVGDMSSRDRVRHGLGL